MMQDIGKGLGKAILYWILIAFILGASCMFGCSKCFLSKYDIKIEKVEEK